VTEDRSVLIVGGGIAGLTLAVALRACQRRRHDRRAREAVEHSRRRISLTGPTLRALKSIGLIDHCVAAGFGFDRITFADAAGNEIGVLDMPRLAGPEYPATVAIGRPLLHELLLRAAEGLRSEIRLGTTVTSLTQRPDGVDVAFPMARAAPMTWWSAATASIRPCAAWSSPTCRVPASPAWRYGARR